MHFDPRTQRALREAGLDADELRAAADRVAELVREEAAALEAFFAEDGPFYSDMETAHDHGGGPREHATAELDAYTHAADLRGYLSFGSWGVYVEDGRTLDDGTVELTLGPTVHDRVRFARDPDAL
jgi:hypothetical protein